MNKILLFFCLALAILVLSSITICVAPIINKADSFFDNWGIQNCQKEKDVYEYNEKNSRFTSDGDKKVEKRKVNECFNQNAMHDLEYTSLIMDIVFSFVCTSLGLLHYFEKGQSIQKISGLIGLITGAIIAIITCIYVGYSASLFNNGVERNHIILYPNKASHKWIDGKYRPDYDEEKYNDDPDIVHPKYRDLGKKQYNYNSESFILDKIYSSEVNQCISTNYNSKKDECEYLWNYGVQYNTEVTNKYIYDRWLTSIIISVFIVACGLGLAAFGFLLFKNSGDSSGKV